MAKMYGRMTELKNEITKMELERPYIIPIEKERVTEDEKENKEVIEIPEDWKKRKAQIETLEMKLKERDEEKRMELNEMNWDDIWSFDGDASIRVDNISYIIKELFFCQSSIKIDVKNASTDFEEISKKQKSIQQEIYEKYLEKIKLKGQIDE
ncbi:hypothetical protein RFI_37831, partial [Reticulomyxa filosa]